jgi:intracellular sulfur oxidation DsrE/DsrF family protein
MRLIPPWLRLLAALVPLLACQPASATEPNDAAALRGVTEGKGIFLIDFNDPRKAAFYLSIIKETHGGMLRQGVRPDLIIVYIGPTVRFLTTRPDSALQLEHEDALESIAMLVKELAALGVRHEVCAIATRVMRIDDATLLPGLTLVADGFISLIGYQTQGYKLVPLF